MADQFHLSHCSQCGSSSPDSVRGGDQGYSACCNEPVCPGGPYCAYDPA